MRIILDGMGGDNAPAEIVKGAVEASKLTDDEICIVGREELIHKELKKYKYDPEKVYVVHAEEVITNDEAPVRAVRSKKDSSLVKGLNMLKDGRGDLFISAGSTGAMMAGGLFIAAWSTYGFETAVCYTREFKDPKKDTFKAIFYSGLLCVAVFTLVPLAFQGHLGLVQLITPAVSDASGAVTSAAVYNGMLAPDIYSGMGVAKALSDILGTSAFIANLVVVMLV